MIAVVGSGSLGEVASATGMERTPPTKSALPAAFQRQPEAPNNS